MFEGKVGEWRVSSHSADGEPDGAGGTCVAVARASSAKGWNGVAIRNSNRPSDGMLVVTAPAFGRLLAAIKEGTA